MDLISRKAAIEAIGERPENWTDTPAEIEAVRSYDNAIDDLKSVPAVPAVPLDRLCEWLAEHYGSPCQLAEIDCYPQCEPDENGECYGMRTDDKKCWHDYLTKWTEGLDADRP